jgi:hypothetical protein
MLKMKQRRRIYYSSEHRNQMWDHWQKGDSMHVIARLFDRGHSSVQRILSEAGGIRPRQRSRSTLALTLSEREEISRGAVTGQSIRSIAELLGRAPSTVSRELNRNGGRQDYRANKAEQAAWDQAHRRKTCKLVMLGRPLIPIYRMSFMHSSRVSFSSQVILSSPPLELEALSLDSSLLEQPNSITSASADEARNRLRLNILISFTLPL